jgi:hypothetical protein
MDLGEWSSGIGKHILKVEDGKSVAGNFRGAMVKFYQHWPNGRSVLCPGRESCQLCASPDEKVSKATGRFRVNFLVRDGNAPLVAKVFEGGRRVYEQLVQLNKDIPLEKAWVRISRIGTKTNTQWTIAVIPGTGGIVNESEAKQIVSVPLHDLRLEDDDEQESA